MTRVMIWPDLYKEHGHWLPCVSLANTLRSAGHSVDFMGIPDCQSVVDPYLVAGDSTTFKTILSSVYPAGYSIENKLEPQGQRWKPHHLLPMCRREDAVGIDAIFNPAKNASPPELLISGYFNALETLLIHYMYGTPIVTITTYLRHPVEGPAMLAKTKLVYMSQPMSQKIIETVTTTVTPKINPTDFDTFIQPLEKAVELIPCPKDFDFKDDDWQYTATNGTNVFYVEPMITRNRFDGSAPAKVFDPKGANVIFGTAGSQVQDYQSRAREFFTNLITMMQTSDMNTYDLVLAVGDALLPQLNIQYGVDTKTSTLPANVFLYPWVSQLDIIGDPSSNPNTPSSTKVVFTHGGLATIKESIWGKVPLVIVPHGKDQLDNALRVQRNGLGLVAQVQETSPTNLRKLFTSATTSAWVQQNMAQMNQIFYNQETASPKMSLDKLTNAGLLS